MVVNPNTEFGSEQVALPIGGSRAVVRKPAGLFMRRLETLARARSSAATETGARFAHSVPTTSALLPPDPFASLRRAWTQRDCQQTT